jgi:putative salt-induced outer membrane protein YdiY
VAAEPPPPEEGSKKPTVSLVAELGAVWLWGNTRSITVNGNLAFGIRGGRHQLTANVAGNYGRALVADVWSTSATKIAGGLRYDLFATDKGSIYVLGGAFHDPFAGMRVRGDAGAGWAQRLVETEKHKLVLEGGFQYAHEEYVLAVAPPRKNFWGARVFLGYALKINETLLFSEDLEALAGGTDDAAARFDGQLKSKTGLSVGISKALSLRFGFDLLWDFIPPEGFQPVDTTTSFTLVAKVT